MAANSLPALTPAQAASVERALSLVERAYGHLCEAVTFQKTRDIRDLAVAAEAYAREAKDTRLLSKATELRARAERKAGKMLTKSAEKGERATRQNAKATRGNHVEDRDMMPPTLAQIGVTRDQSSKWQQVGAVSDEEFESALATTQAVMCEVSTPKVLRAIKQTRERGTRQSRQVTADFVPTISPPRHVTENEAATHMFRAIETLAQLPYSPAVLCKALVWYQHHHVTDNLPAATAALSELSKQPWILSKKQKAS